MDFSFTDDQNMIRDAAEGFLADASDSAAMRRAAEQGYDAAVWTRIGAELGWCGVPVPEAQGGLGLCAVEMVLLMEQMGRRLLASPFFATVGLGATLLNEMGSDVAQAQWLPRIAQGDLRLGVPLDWQPVLKADGANRLNGTLKTVLDGDSADTLLLPAEHDGVLGWYVLPRESAGVTVEAAPLWDGTRRVASVTMNNAAATRVDDPARCATGTARALALARLYLAAESLGGAQQCLDLTVAYTLGRKQFGRVIAGFQAIKHRCAEMMVRIEGLRSAVYGAAAAGAPELECAAVRALAADTYFACAQEAIQLHGGVGFTWEYDPQLYFKRAQMSSHALGAASRLRADIADALLGAVEAA